MPREHELNGYLQQWRCTYEMRQDCLEIGFAVGTILFGAYEDSNLSSESGDTGKGLSLLGAASLLSRAEVRSAHLVPSLLHTHHAPHRLRRLLRSLRTASRPRRYRNIRTKFSIWSRLAVTTSELDI